jgi:hypothetical protein
MPLDPLAASVAFAKIAKALILVVCANARMTIRASVSFMPTM